MYNATKDDTVQSLKSTGQNFRDNAADAASQAKDDLTVAANKAGRKVRSFIHNASDELTHATDTVTTQIRSNPVQSSLIALGAGFVLGALFRR